MTIYEWRKLKPGDKVWVKPTYFSFPLLGVVKLKGGKKVVWLNLYGEAQCVWGHDNIIRSLANMAVYQEGMSAAISVMEAKDRHCQGCKHLRQAADGEFSCEQFKNGISKPSIDCCAYWMPRPPVKLQIKKRKNAQKTDVKAKHANETS